jgi:hypothetical protein
MENDQVPPVQSVPQSVVPPEQMQQPPQTSLSKKVIIIGGIILIVVIVLLSVAFYVLRTKGSDQVNSVTPTPVNAPTITLVPTVIPSITMTLEKGKSQIIPDTDIKIEYIGANIPNPNCADCSSTTNVTLQKDSISKTLNFLCGGIAGKCLDKLSEFGYEITLTSGTETVATVSIKKL